MWYQLPLCQVWDLYHFSAIVLKTCTYPPYYQENADPKNWRCETLYIGDYKYVNISSFVLLGIKLWLKEDGDLIRNDPSDSFNLIQSKAQDCYKMLLSFSYNFISNIAYLTIFLYLLSSNNKSFISQNLEDVGPLGGMFDFFSPSGFEILSDFDYRTSKTEFYSVRALKCQWRKKIYFLNRKCPCNSEDCRLPFFDICFRFEDMTV